MFGIFTKKPKHTPQAIFYELGACAKDIVDAASANNDLEVALKSAATITPILGESKKFFDLNVKPHSILASYLIALQDQNRSKMPEMTRGMA